LLFQMPPKQVFDEKATARFFEQARSLLRADFAIEPRHASWFTEETDAFLTELRIARVAADPIRHGDGEPGGWGGLRYYRLHGAPRTYYSNYDDAALIEIRRRLGFMPGIPTWCIFDNTAAGAALGNAVTVARRISNEPE
jgi:uncharacterized protein YecE (DUF72 family)